MSKKPKYNVSVDSSRFSAFCKDLILISMHEKDEIDTRVALFHNNHAFKDRYTEPGDFEALDAAEDFFDAMSFEELKDYYHKCLNGEEQIESTKVTNWTDDKEEEDMNNNKNYGPLFKQVFLTKAKDKELELFLQGEEEHSYHLIKTFEFENNHYAYLKASSDGVTRCYRYAVENRTGEYGEKEEIEKLIYINDEQLLKLFDFLKL